ncbi:methyltransferase [Amycolatopsis sp. NPDC059021]|uniref:methyltransferase n=1 Tax=Amycolatopsis sp. NPDC059021 TaxID=3346704 RepID=UPI00366F0B73
MTTRETVLGWLRGAKAAHLAGVFVRLGLAELITEGQGSLDTLARACDMAPERMIRLLRGFADIGLCAEDDREVFTLTEAGAALREDDPLSDTVRITTDPVTERAWAAVEAGVRSGRGGFHEAFGMPIFEYMDGAPELHARYDRFMSRHTTTIAEEVGEHHDFGRYRSAIDVGGGDGTLLAVLSRRYPDLRGQVFDRADGDFLREVPAGADAYLLKWILHDWPDDDAVTILRNCRAAMPPHATVLVIELILPERGSPDRPRDPELTDLHMLTIYGGQERTRAEFGRLFDRAGLTIERVTPLPSGLSLLEAVPA